jgi:hypothetical protein
MLRGDGLTRSAVVLASVALAAGACSSDDAATEATSATPVVAAPVTVPASRQTAFCAGMIDLQLDLQDDPDLGTDQILERYRELLPEAPTEIGGVLSAVIEQLAVGSTASSVASTTIALVSITAAAGGTVPEASVLGYLPEEDPALRLNDYVQFACRSTGNNPGPAPTQPNLAVDTTA